MKIILNKIKNLNKNSFLKWLLIYTPLFSVISFFLIYIFAKYDKSFIWATDGLNQHTVTLKYFRTLLIDFIKTGSISTFTWNIGCGFDLFSNLAYYIFGDIFSYLSILFPTNKMELLYNSLVILRIYFVGISFLCYCRYKKMNLFSSIIGALMYTFSSFVLYSAVRHPYFINAIIIFPLVMIGIEKIILENKPIFYTLIITITFLISFYFAYMISLIIAIYGTILAIYTYKKEGYKKIFRVLIKVLLYSLLGISISAVFLLPTLIGFIKSERSMSSTIFPYSTTYYRNFLNELLTVNTTGYWKIIGVQSIIFVSLPIFIRNRKENYPLFFLFLTLLLPLLFSKIASIFCGFGFPFNRWSFVMIFIFSFITTLHINSDVKMDKKALISIGLFALLYLGINIIFEINLEFYTQIQLFILIIILLIMFNKEKINSIFKKINMYKILLLVVFCLGILSSIKYLYDIDGNNYVSQFIEYGTLEENHSTSHNTISDFSKALKYINKNDNSYYKISKYPYFGKNLPLIKNYNSIGSCYSITPNLLSSLPLDLNNIQYSVSQGIKEFDYRTKITSLLGVKYYINTGENIVPYGYSLMENYNGTSNIYYNNYSLPFGVLYTDYITLDEYENLNSLEKETSLLKTTVLSDDIISNSNLTHNKEIDYNNIISEIDYEIIDKNHIINGNNITITKTKANSIKLNIGEIKNSELYICLKGLEYTPYSKKDSIELEINEQSTKQEIEQIEKNYKWYEPNYSYTVKVQLNNVSKSKSVENIKSAYYVEYPEMLFNLGYYENLSQGETITLKFSKIGNYTFDSIKIYAVSMNDYTTDIKNLSKSNFEVIDYKDGYMSGILNAEENGVLQFSTTYDNGWKVYVDEKQVDTFVSNKYFLGINVEKGEHTICLKYSNPYIVPGLVISIIGIVILLIIIYRKKWRYLCKEF